MKTLLPMLAILLLLGETPAVGAPDEKEPSARGVLEPINAPVEPAKSKVLKGGASVSSPGGALNGQVDDGTGAAPLSGQAAADEPSAAMKAAFKLYGEDAGNRALEIKWDAWRNRFLRAAEERVMQANRANPDPSRARYGGVYPHGTEATFDCEINDQRRITDLKIVKSSGFREFDRSVFQGIQSLDGARLLEFPAKSQRKSVRQPAVMYAAEANPGFTPFNFGDVERLIEQSTPKKPAD